MGLGFFGSNVGGMASAEAPAVARTVESLGYESIWAAEHVVLPKPRVGLGQIDREFDAVGVPTRDKGKRFREYVEAMFALWNDESPECAAEFVSFVGVDAYPRPTTAGGPPIVMGGYAPSALDDAARFATGWYGFGLTPEATAKVVTVIRARLREAGRDESAFEIFLTLRIRLDEVLVAAYGQAGVTELVVSAESSDVEGIKRSLQHNAPANLGIEPAHSEEDIHAANI